MKIFFILCEDWNTQKSKNKNKIYWWLGKLYVNYIWFQFFIFIFVIIHASLNLISPSNDNQRINFSLNILTTKSLKFARKSYRLMKSWFRFQLRTFYTFLAEAFPSVSVNLSKWCSQKKTLSFTLVLPSSILMLIWLTLLSVLNWVESLHKVKDMSEIFYDGKGNQAFYLVKLRRAVNKINNFYAYSSSILIQYIIWWATYITIYLCEIITIINYGYYLYTYELFYLLSPLTHF